VPHLESQWVFGKQFEETDKMIVVRGRVGKGPGKLDQYRPQPAFGFERFDPEFEFVSVLYRKVIPLVSEDLMELYREQKLGETLDPSDPGKRDMQRGRPVKGAVDLNDVDEPRQKIQGMKVFAFFFGINKAFPVFVAPSCCPDVIACHFRCYCIKITAVSQCLPVALGIFFDYHG
jgi:hypothetical protein